MLPRMPGCTVLLLLLHLTTAMEEHHLFGQHIGHELSCHQLLLLPVIIPRGGSSLCSSFTPDFWLSPDVCVPLLAVWCAWEFQAALLYTV